MLNKQRREKPAVPEIRQRGERRRAASASASTRTSAPATTPASGSRAARRSRSSTPTTRCRTIRSRRSTTVALAAAIAARWPRRRCSARRSTAPTSSTTRTGSIAASRGPAARRDRLPATSPRSGAASPSPIDAGIASDERRIATLTRFTTERPISIAVLAIGGQGGGVLTDWIVALAEMPELGSPSDLGAGRRPAHRRDRLLRRDAAAEGAADLRPILSLMPARARSTSWSPPN